MRRSRKPFTLSGVREFESLPLRQSMQGPGPSDPGLFLRGVSRARLRRGPSSWAGWTLFLSYEPSCPISRTREQGAREASPRENRVLQSRVHMRKEYTPAAVERSIFDLVVTKGDLPCLRRPNHAFPGCEWASSAP